MAANVSSVQTVGDKVILIQFFVACFLCINLLLLSTFFRMDYLRTTMRYILFALMLMNDCFFLLLSDILLILVHFHITIQIRLCLLIYVTASVTTFVTPFTLTAMTLERYVAICMPLRHADLCTTRRALHCVLIIHGLSSVPCTVILSAFFASAPHSFYSLAKLCSVENFVLHVWQSHLRSAVSQLNFLLMCSVIVFSCVKVMNVARAASGEDRKSMQKGLRTVILHGFQMLLSVLQLWCPFIEAELLQIDFMLFINVRYFNYIMFILTPRCLSPLIYGLRDEKYFMAMRNFVLRGLCNVQLKQTSINKSPLD